MTCPVALSCGEPAGIGPELAVKAWERLGSDCPFFWIGDPHHLPEGTPVQILDAPAATDPRAGLPVLPLEMPGAVTPGRANPDHAAGVIEAIRTGVALCMNGAARGLCTAPIHKKALIDGAGFAYPGHTEFLSALAGVDRVVMMLASAELRVVPATIHIPLARVPEMLTPDLLRDTIRITAVGLRTRFGIARPRIAVAGLNPHAGEGGAMGHEELDWIAGLLASIDLDGVSVTGPLPADTMFHPAARAGYDAAVCMYHDQALIPIKTIAFDSGVNVTLGLPFVRTSPDHGTAFDIAGRGLADPSSLIEAIRMAHAMGKTAP